jgi:hypothetical protein
LIDLRHVIFSDRSGQKGMKLSMEIVEKSQMSFSELWLCVNLDARGEMDGDGGDFASSPAENLEDSATVLSSR